MVRARVTGKGEGGWALGLGRLGRPGGEGNGQRPGWAYLSLLSLLYFLKIENKSRKKGEERKVEIEFWARGLFSRTRKNMLDPGKIEVGMIERFKFKLI